MVDFILKYWLQVLFGAIIAIFTFTTKHLFKKIKKEITEQYQIKMGLQALLRDRIYQGYKDCEEVGFCTLYERENINCMFNEYKNLGGNSTVCSLVGKINDLPGIPPKVDLKIE